MPRVKPIVVKGVRYPSIKAAAKAHGICLSTVRRRLDKGVPIDQAFTAELMNTRPTPITVNGVRYPSISEAARAHGVSCPTALGRLVRGVPIDEAFTAESMCPRAKPIVVKGVKYPSIAAAARAHGISLSTVQGRMAKGVPIDQAFKRRRKKPRKSKRHGKQRVGNLVFRSPTAAIQYYECMQPSKVWDYFNAGHTFESAIAPELAWYRSHNLIDGDGNRLDNIDHLPKSCLPLHVTL